MSQRVPPQIPEREILEAIRELKFGVVEVYVHESQVTEIRQVRRTRFAHSAPTGSSNPEMRSTGKAAS
jgi:hypothetical protein